jgi:hypothetical protein
MRTGSLLKCAVLVLALVCLFPRPAMAYVGPGAGLSAIGAFLAIFVGIIVAIFGFLWYPFKRLLRKFKKPSHNEKDGEKE